MRYSISISELWDIYVDECAEAGRSTDEGDFHEWAEEQRERLEDAAAERAFEMARDREYEGNDYR